MDAHPYIFPLQKKQQRQRDALYMDHHFSYNHPYEYSLLDELILLLLYRHTQEYYQKMDDFRSMQ